MKILKHNYYILGGFYYDKNLRISILAAKMLKEASEDCIFTLNGGHIFRIFQECQKEGIRVLDVCHE